ncbi:hypothetical protein SAMN02583745_00028 [Thorsellia anophelis DSM 18579]|uniref:Divergent polysaccharide deacetylase n=2 Tax=Thorsellia anophelis TaxID=336804 RepID=A0A1H9Y4K6_9GAMM|nr:hypothetical protein SAMN02583745_00028 [Thorsellia anophelis DSM 18579]
MVFIPYLAFYSVIISVSANASIFTQTPRPTFPMTIQSETISQSDAEANTEINIEPESSKNRPLSSLPERTHTSKSSEQQNIQQDPKFIAPLTTISENKAKLVIVIDDLGYIKRDFQILDLPVTVAIIPTAPYATERAEIAFANQREILIHLPMLPFSRSGLEKDTLTPDMSQTEITTIIERSILAVPHAVGINNHTGSEMTASFEGMKKVFHALSGKSLFFLDSLTTGKSQVASAASEFNHPVLIRDIFLDNIQTEQSVNTQFNLAIAIARKKGVSIAIGHPHQATINVLKRRLADLPDDIELVTLQSILND